MCWINTYRQRRILFPLNYSKSHFPFYFFVQLLIHINYHTGQTKSFYFAFLLGERKKERQTESFSTCIHVWFCHGPGWKVKCWIWLSHKIIKLLKYVYVYFMCNTLHNNMYAKRFCTCITISQNKSIHFMFMSKKKKSP